MANVKADIQRAGWTMADILGGLLHLITFKNIIIGWHKTLSNIYVALFSMQVISAICN